MLQSILKHYNEDGTADYESMSSEEKAFAHLFDELFLVIEDYELFDMDSSDWREICYLQGTQDYLIGSFLENWETKRANALQRRAKDPDFEYKHWMDRPDEYIGGKSP